MCRLLKTIRQILIVVALSVLSYCMTILPVQAHISVSPQPTQPALQLLAQTSPPKTLQPTSQPAPQIVEGIEKIKLAMAKVHFCYNENCFYRNIESKIAPPATADGKYTAVISAIIDRPSAVLDTADYHFEFASDRWQLLKGEEYTDVADYVFVGDRYEIYSVHSNRTIRGNLAQAKREGNLKSGYINLYYDVLNEGIERTP